MRRYILVPILLLFTLAVHADEKSLRQRLQDEHALGEEHWLYNDIEAARAMAIAKNKPIFVTFRCVPCRDCKSFDAEVAGGSQLIKALASRAFVCVRQVEMKGVDLSQFQFDYDLNWAAMFINANGTVYARYGTQSAAGSEAYNSVEGLLATMNRVLELHAKYPHNAKELAGKLGKKKPYRTAMDMPGLPGSAARLKEQTSRRNCIHCHMLHDAEHDYARQLKNFDREILWRYPLPENIGITVDAKDGQTISKLNDACLKLGLKIGSRITHVNGQAITSIADIQWVLHNLPNDKAAVRVTTVQGDQKPATHKMAFKQGWKKTDISWRGSIFSFSPRTNVWCPPLSDSKRTELNLKDAQNALEVRWINTDQATQPASLQQGDVVLKVGGVNVPDTDAKLQTLLKLNYDVGQKVPLTVLRGDRRLEVSLALVE